MKSEIQEPTVSATVTRNPVAYVGAAEPPCRRAKASRSAARMVSGTALRQPEKVIVPHDRGNRPADPSREVWFSLQQRAAAVTPSSPRDGSIEEMRHSRAESLQLSDGGDPARRDDRQHCPGCAGMNVKAATITTMVVYLRCTDCCTVWPIEDRRRPATRWG